MPYLTQARACQPLGVPGAMRIGDRKQPGELASLQRLDLLTRLRLTALQFFKVSERGSS